MTDLDWLTIEMVQSREAMLRNLDRALELVREHYRKLENRPRGLGGVPENTLAATKPCRSKK
jgi:hypothetical protein